jgi:hypothetical protein
MDDDGCGVRADDPELEFGFILLAVPRRRQLERGGVERDLAVLARTVDLDLVAARRGQPAVDREVAELSVVPSSVK